MFRFITCCVLGHKRWPFMEPGVLMYFKQASVLGNEAYEVEICQRCNLLYARKPNG